MGGLPAGAWPEGVQPGGSGPPVARKLPASVLQAGHGPEQLDACIQIVWPHDERGELRPAAEVPLVNIAVDLFAHGTLDSVPLDYEPDDLSLLVADENSPPTLRGVSTWRRQEGTIGAFQASYTYEQPAHIARRS